MRRFLVLPALAVTLAMVAPAQAKPFTYTDPKGDVPANAGLDIVGVTYATEGTTSVRKVGRKTVKTYQPLKLVVTMTLAGAPVEQAGIRYRVEAQVAECGPMTFSYAPALSEAALDATSQLVVGCGGSSDVTGGDSVFLDPKFSVKGSSLVWSIPLKTLPKPARAGGLLYGLASSVDVVEPVLGALGPDDVGSEVLDTARSDADWDIA